MDPNAEDYELTEALLPPEQQDGLSKPRGGRKTSSPLRVARETRSRGISPCCNVFTTVTWVIILVNNPFNAGWFAFHPPLQSLSIALLVYGIMTLQPTSQPKTKAAGLARHQYAILFAAFPIIFFGTFAIMYNKYVHGAIHFRSWHGKLGIVAMGWIFIQVLLGGGSVWFGGAAFGGGSKAKAIWKYHRLSGYVLFMLLMLTAHIGGAWSNWGIKYSPWSMRVLAYGASLLACITGLYIRVRPSKMRFY
ncbi:Cytochrome b561 domain-containing protein [Mycena venus]|uniref:Cytochrome b561 domain-containing protein n=1 Tax=Mycena venus TaxID=2733690 RepID=A0A8H6XCM3_9AGAR|nr:Cytochrome b561 domain-containing protein [Mycena venus]